MGHIESYRGLTLETSARNILRDHILQDCGIVMTWTPFGVCWPYWEFRMTAGVILQFALQYGEVIRWTRRGQALPT